MKRRRPEVTVRQQWAGQYCDGADRFIPYLPLRGVWLGEVFEVGAKVRVTREERAGKLVLVLEEITTEETTCPLSD